MSTLSNEKLLAMYRLMVTIRHFEDYLYKLFLQGRVPGTLHQYQGQEAVAVGVCSVLQQDDIIFSTHRPVGHGIAKGMRLEAIAAELWGKATGCAGGKGGQMHLTDVTVGMMPSNAIVGANIPIATGAALGFKLRGETRVAVSFFGDGAANIGAFHEGINLAAVKNAPVVFVCENNQFAASTHISLATKIENIAERAAAYGIPGVIVDGMEVLAVHEAADAAIKRARSGLGPTLIEAKTYRYKGHSRGDPGKYRSKEELDRWQARDPLPNFREQLLSQGIKEDTLTGIEGEVDEAVEEAIQLAENAPEPDPMETYTHVFAESREQSMAESTSREMTMAEALRDAMRLALRADSNVFLLGEDIGVEGGFGGGFTVTLGLADEFGHDRVMDTPISEAAIIGAAVGAAMIGMRPVAEMQYGDFVFGGMDQVVNQAAKMHYMSNGQVRVPMVLRLPVGASRRGAQHAQSTEAYWMHTPGLKVVCPSNPYDAKGLLYAAIRDDNPVIFLEHKLLYGGKGGRKERTSLDPVMQVPDEPYEVPLGTVKVVREGTDVTILANMLMVYRALAAADQLAEQDIQAEVIDMRCLVPMDMETLGTSLKKTNRVLIVEEDNLTAGWGAEVAARLGEKYFYYLDAPIQRVAAPDTPAPTALSLEGEYLPDTEKIAATVRRLMEGW